MKKRIALIIALCVLALSLCACAPHDDAARALGGFLRRAIQRGLEGELRPDTGRTAFPGLELPEIIIPVSTAAPDDVPDDPQPTPVPNGGDVQFPRL